MTTRSVRIRHDEANHCIIVVWRQYATHIQFRYIHEKLLSLICEHRVYKLLGDDTALPAIPSEDRFWIIDEWFPRAVKCGLRFAASKQPDAHFGRVAVTISNRRLRPACSAEPSRSWKKRGNGSIATHRNGIEKGVKVPHEGGAFDAQFRFASRLSGKRGNTPGIDNSGPDWGRRVPIYTTGGGHDEPQSTPGLSIAAVQGSRHVSRALAQSGKRLLMWIRRPVVLYGGQQW